MLQYGHVDFTQREDAISTWWHTVNAGLELGYTPKMKGQLWALPHLANEHGELTFFTRGCTLHADVLEHRLSYVFVAQAGDPKTFAADKSSAYVYLVSGADVSNACNRLMRAEDKEWKLCDGYENLEVEPDDLVDAALEETTRRLLSDCPQIQEATSAIMLEANSGSFLY